MTTQQHQATDFTARMTAINQFIIEIFLNAL